MRALFSLLPSHSEAVQVCLCLDYCVGRSGLERHACTRSPSRNSHAFFLVLVLLFLFLPAIALRVPTACRPSLSRQLYVCRTPTEHRLLAAAGHSIVHPMVTGDAVLLNRLTRAGFSDGTTLAVFTVAALPAVLPHILPQGSVTPSITFFSALFSPQNMRAYGALRGAS